MRGGTFPIFGYHCILLQLHPVRMGNLLTPLRHRRRTVRQFSGSNDTEAAVLECVGLTASRYRALILDNNRADLTALDAHALHQSRHFCQGEHLPFAMLYLTKLTYTSQS